MLQMSFAFAQNCFATVLSEPGASHPDCKPEYIQKWHVCHHGCKGRNLNEKTVSSQGERLIRRCSNC